MDDDDHDKELLHQLNVDREAVESTSPKLNNLIRRSANDTTGDDVSDVTRIGHSSTTAANSSKSSPPSHSIDEACYSAAEGSTREGLTTTSTITTRETPLEPTIHHAGVTGANSSGRQSKSAENEFVTGNNVDILDNYRIIKHSCVTANSITPATTDCRASPSKDNDRVKNNTKKTSNAAVRRFYAIKSCNFFQAPAIFMSLYDFELYIDQEDEEEDENNDDTIAQYEIFDDILLAMEYIDSDNRNYDDDECCTESTTMDGSNQSNTNSKKKKNKETSTTMNRQDHTSVAVDTTPADNCDNDDNNNVNRHDGRSSSNADGGSNRVGKNVRKRRNVETTTALQKKNGNGDDHGRGSRVKRTKRNTDIERVGGPTLRSAHRSSVRREGNNSKNADEINNDDDEDDNNTRRQKRRKRSVHDQQWEDKFQLLKEFKLQFGHCEVPRNCLNKQQDKCDDDNHAGAATTSSSPDGDDSTLFRYGPLLRWISFIRKQWEDYDIDPTTSTCLTEERIERLKLIGFVRYPKGKGKNTQPPASIVHEVNRQARLQQQNARGAKRAKSRRETTQGGSNVQDNPTSRGGGQNDDDVGDGLNVANDENALGIPQHSMSTRDIKWEQKFQWLLQYKQEHGNIQVPSDRTGPYASLVRWVLFVRRQIALYNEDPKKAPSLNDTKLFRLEELGFDISGGSDRPQPTWDEMFEKLQRYKEEHGTITIPKKKSTDLRNWIARQRYQYDKLRQGKSSLMTKDQMDKLTSIGFSFTSTYTKCSFDERAAQWLEYTSKHGQDVSTSWRAKMPDGRNSLGSWVKKTRQKYAQLQKGQPANLTQEQIDRLTRWGFDWKYKAYNAE